MIDSAMTMLQFKTLPPVSHGHRDEVETLKTEPKALPHHLPTPETPHNLSITLVPIPGIYSLCATSDDLGWTALHSSIYAEQAHETQHKASADVWLTVSLDNNTLVTRDIRGRKEAGLLAKGAVSVRPAGMEAQVALENQATVNHVFLSTQIIEEVSSTLFAGDPTNVEIIPRFGSTDAIIENMLAATRAALPTPSGAATLYIDYVARALAAHLLLHHSNKTEITPSLYRRSPLSARQISHVTEYIHANIESPILIDNLARLAGLSPTHFTRCLLKSTGFTPHQYVLHLRVELAKRLLAQSNLPIKEVAFSCGFSSQAHLTDAFSNRVGAPPFAYRLNHR